MKKTVQNDRTLLQSHDRLYIQAKIAENMKQIKKQI